MGLSSCKWHWPAEGIKNTCSGLLLASPFTQLNLNMGGLPQFGSHFCRMVAKAHRCGHFSTASGVPFSLVSRRSRWSATSGYYMQYTASQQPDPEPQQNHRAVSSTGRKSLSVYVQDIHNKGKKMVPKISAMSAAPLQYQSIPLTLNFPY